jgi:hypothetical protein
LEINRSVQARENTEWLIQFLNAGVGNRDTAARADIVRYAIRNKLVDL